VEADAMIQPFGLEPDLVVGQLVGCETDRCKEDALQWRLAGTDESGGPVESTRSETLRPRVVQHRIRCNLPRQIGAAAEAGVLLTQADGSVRVRLVTLRHRQDIEIEAAVADPGNAAGAERVEATGTAPVAATLGTLFVGVHAVVARSGGDCQRLGNDVEVQ